LSPAVLLGTVTGLSHPPPPNAAPWPDDHEPTEFQRAVVEAVTALEAGELVTYGELAEELGRPGGGQAVANVLRSVPDLPWWRVVPSDGRLYCSHAPVQAPLLEAEGHHIDEHRRFRPRSSARR
jgi:methylated-DNA-protein-cysteine methyltransferase-like protein